MKTFLLSLVIISMAGCGKTQVDSSLCGWPGATRKNPYVKDFPVTVISWQAGAYQLAAGNDSRWGSCNLPDQFKQDSLKILVSGYFLTSPELELMNVNPVPFEVTDARLR